MEKRVFRNGGENVSLLGFGAMRLPTRGTPADIDSAASTKMVDYAYEQGVNYFDTAYPYHEGKSELFLGEALRRYPRDTFFLASKMPFWNVESAADLPKLFDEQLRKCRVEYFDFYLGHNLNASLYEVFLKSNAAEFLGRMKKEGKIRHVGFSFHDKPELLETIVKNHSWDFVQLQINYLDWELQRADRQYEIAAAAGLPVVVMEPLRGGSLAKLVPGAVEALQQTDSGASVASWAMRYVASLDNVVTVLSGMSTLAQVEDNVKTFARFQPLSAAEREAIDRARGLYLATGAVPCTSCRYCLPCPVGVDIPTMFTIYNDFKVRGEQFYFTMEYDLYGEKAKAENCVECNQCLEKCPQGIAIPKQLKKIAAEAKAGT